MNNRTDILNELKEISSVVAGLPAGVPYELPEAYFEQLDGEVLKRIQAPGQNEITVPWLPAALKHPFEVPAGFFENFSGNLLTRIKAMDADASQEETAALSPLLGGLSKKLPFSFPEAYFTELPGEIISGIQAIDFVNQELETLSPVMAAAGKANVYEVPEGYFTRLAPAILHQAKAAQRGRVIRGNFGKMIMQYAAAALLAGALATGAWLFVHDKAAADTTADMAAIKKISNDEMVQYLENNPVAFSESSLASGDPQAEDIKELLADIPQNELEQYVDQNAISKNTAIN